MNPTTDDVVGQSQTLRADIEVIGLVGVAHGASHFYQLALPPLFPFLREEFGLSWTMLGAITTVFFIISGVGQALAGFVVDRFGARRTLMVGMCSMSAGATVAAFAPGYAALLVSAMLIGFGNCVMHPADYAILNSKISPRRIGHAFSVHGLSGNLGYAAGPALLYPMALLYGWRVAMGSAAVIGLIVLGIILFRPRSFEVLERSGIGSPAAGSSAPAASGRMASAAPSAAPAGRSMMGLPSWLSPSVILCFLFFVAVTLASTGLQNFAPQALQVIYGISASTATGALTLYLMAGACGMFAGGFAAAASNRHERIAMACLIGCSLLLFGLASGIAPSFMILPVLALAGFFLGILQPSRDMLVRKAAPVKASGRVFGLVYSGIDVGGAIGPAILGSLLDHQHPGAAIAVAATAVMAGVAVAAAIAQSLARKLG